MRLKWAREAVGIGRRTCSFSGQGWTGADSHVRMEIAAAARAYRIYGGTVRIGGEQARAQIVPQEICGWHRGLHLHGLWNSCGHIPYGQILSINGAKRKGCGRSAESAKSDSVVLLLLLLLLL